MSLLEQLAYAWPHLNAAAQWRVVPEDFQVNEELGFEPDGEGEHVLLQIEKRDANTQWIAKKLARLADVKLMDVSYAGLKDRFAVTTQWFSVRLAGKANPDWDAIDDEEYKVLQWHYHRRKLKRGSLRANHFKIILRQLDGDKTKLEQRLQLIQQTGVPNYFTEQRFGRDEGNIRQAKLMLTGKLRVRDRHKRSLYLSAARSMLFNLVLSSRIEQQTWNQILPDEIVMLAGSRSTFIATEVDELIVQRLGDWDIDPSGPLVGDGNDKFPQYERDVLSDYQDWCEGLEKARLEPARRALRLRVSDLHWEFLPDEQLYLEFRLGKGSYASAVIRELLVAEIPKRQF